VYVSARSQVVRAFLLGDRREQGTDFVPQGFHAASRGLTQQGLEPGEELLDRIEVGGIRRQVEYSRARRRDLLGSRLAGAADRRDPGRERLDVSPDPLVMLDGALQEAARTAGIELTVEDGAVYLVL